MADNQVALSRMTRAASGSLSKATRQAVPPFLQKLYEMVSDTATDNLIRWSETGDSFFVLDHERVAHDVLPRWFKHSNFASFVRQLNMYGFHKIPHLQQGVLKSESDTEIWNFEHPNFRRGQPDLLCLITRKKQAAERQNEDASLGGDRDGGVAPGLVGGFTSGSLVDINSIINGIAAIKRHQATISADLNDLKVSNQHLWQEALDARERHQKQQDTINRILKFLAGVFGNAGAHKAAPVHGSPHAGIPRKRQRLMIEGAAQSVKDKTLDHPLDTVEPTVETASEDGHLQDRFVEVAHSPAPSKPPSVVSDSTEPRNHATDFQAQPPMTADIIMGGNFNNQQPFLPFANSTLTPNSDNAAVYPRSNEPTSPGALTANSPAAREELLQSIINSPGSFQRLLTLLNFQQQQQNVPMPPPLDLNDPSKADSNTYVDNTFDPYAQPPYQQPPDPTLTMPNNFDIVEPDPHAISLLHTDDVPGISFEPYIENANRLKKTSDASSVITEQVDMMDANIESLIKHLGLDQHQLENIREDGYGVNTAGSEADNESLFNHDHDEQQQQQQQQQRQPNAAAGNTTASNRSSGVNTKASSESASPPTTTTNANANTVHPTNVPFQPTIPEFDFNVFLDELAKQRGEVASGPGFGDYKPDGGLDSLIVDSTDNDTVNVNGGKLGVMDPSSTSPELSAFVDEIASQSGESVVSGLSHSPPRTRSGGGGSGAMSDRMSASPTAVTVPLPDAKKMSMSIDSTTPSTAARKRKSESIDATPGNNVTATDNNHLANTRSQTKARRKR